MLQYADDTVLLSLTKKKKKIPSPPPALVEALTPGPSLSVCPCSRAECRAVSKSTVDSLTDTLVRCIVGNRRQINTVEDNDFSKVFEGNT